MLHARRVCALLVCLLLAYALPTVESADPGPKLPKGVTLEEQPRDAKQVKIVLVAGSNAFKAGEHEYVGGCAVLMDLLRQTPGVFPVLALDWPKNAETFAGARAVVFFFDGGDKHGVLKDDRVTQVQKLADAGAGLVQLHQAIDYPKDLGDRARGWSGAAWEKGYSQRAHWVYEFKAFPDHPIARGVKPFTIDDGWLYKLRFVPDKKGVTPLLRTVSPKTPGAKLDADDAIVSWAYDRPAGGRAFTFTGCHLHKSFAEEGYRRFLVNGILWAAGVEIPKDGAPVALTTDLERYLPNSPPAKSDKKD
jgi:trehalose utilization protein